MQARILPILELVEHITRFTSRQFAEKQIVKPDCCHMYTKFAVDTYKREHIWGERYALTLQVQDCSTFLMS